MPVTVCPGYTARRSPHRVHLVVGTGWSPFDGRVPHLALLFRIGSAVRVGVVDQRMEVPAEKIVRARIAEQSKRRAVDEGARAIDVGAMDAFLGGVHQQPHLLGLDLAPGLGLLPRLAQTLGMQRQRRLACQTLDQSIRFRAARNSPTPVDHHEHALHVALQPQRSRERREHAEAFTHPRADP